MVIRSSFFSLLLLFVIVNATTVFFTDIGVNTLIKISPTHCKIYTNRHLIKFIIKFHADVVYVNETTLDKYKNICQESLNSPTNGIFSYPGTLWCGPGFRARSYDVLGFYYKEDICCRDHDHCENFIVSGSCKENLCNHTPFTRSHCDCDRKLKRCLQDTNSEIGNTIGAIFFNIAQIICFEDNPNCQMTDTNSDVNSTCARYRFVNAGQYSAISTASFSSVGKKEYLLNILLRKIGFL